jgi:hypothetical protein
MSSERPVAIRGCLAASAAFNERAQGLYTQGRRFERGLTRAFCIGGPYVSL